MIRPWPCFAVLLGSASILSAQTVAKPPAVFQKYCFECHDSSKAKPKGGISIDRLLAQPSVGPHADEWDKVAEMLETSEMPPSDATEFPTEVERATAATWVRTALKTYEREHGGEPGRVTMRRLTSGEYAYAIRDLTGVDIDVGIDASSDSVGGEGFTNFGDVQFVQDASIERYLEAAKRVAEHAVIGAGPVQFSPYTGLTGEEMFAVMRINNLYATHGFRLVSGEGGAPFGLDHYSKAFFAAWYFKHRAALGDPKSTLRELAVREGLTVKFTELIWSTVNRSDLRYPSQGMVDRWKSLPAPTADGTASLKTARAACDELQNTLTSWPVWFFSRGALAKDGKGDESPLIFNDTSLKAEAKHRFAFALGNGRGFGRGFGGGFGAGSGRGRAGGATAPSAPAAPGTTRVTVNFDNLNPLPGAKPVVIWRNAQVVTRGGGGFRGRGRGGAGAVDDAAQDDADGQPRVTLPQGPIIASQPLRELLSPEVAAVRGFGHSPDVSQMGPDDFVATGPLTLDIKTPTATGGTTALEVEAEIGTDRNVVVRLAPGNSEGVPTPGPARGAQSRVILGDPKSAGYKNFRAGIAEYLALMPPNSFGEANPADKDPVPLPFDSTYNTPEHDAFVLKVKYQRSDKYFADYLVDDADRARLDQAWNDLLSTWPYHDGYLSVLADHYAFKLKSPHIQDLDAAQIAAMPAEMQKYLAPIRVNYAEVMKAENLAEPGHMDDVLAFASRAWRRPLASAEKTRLRDFYQHSRTVNGLDHDDAIRAVLARVLVSPAFLYRVETVANRSERPLNDWELASRMSFFLWASIPDDELRRAAAAGELSKPAMLAKQVKRMTADPKARRLATEFFGQWLGFYRFDEYRGVDTGRFPEFTDEVKLAMYDEAVSTFEYLVRHERPVKELLFADYTFLNRTLAKFYGIDKDVKSKDAVELVEGANSFNRGGALRLGVMLTTTSAPLRTSPVKRGDWILRRILGTPTPPPPADAGTIPRDDKAFNGQTLREQLDAHKRNATCAACHLKIDPLGFPLEGFDPVGRTRDKYFDGKPVDVTAEFADKTVISGTDGLLKYLQTQDKQVTKMLARKMLGYALGRTVQASDRPLLNEMAAAGGGATFSDLAVKIVTSRQFRNHQGLDADSLAEVTRSSQ